MARPYAPITGMLISIAKACTRAETICAIFAGEFSGYGFRKPIKGTVTKARIGFSEIGQTGEKSEARTNQALSLEFLSLILERIPKL